MNNTNNGELRFAGPIDVDSLTAEGRAKLGPLIKARRESRDLTQAELALMSGVDRKTIGTIESGKRAGQAEKLRMLLEALEVPQLSDVDRHYSAETRMFIASTAPIFDQLPPEAQTEAQNDVVVLLTGKLARSAQRAANVPTAVDTIDHVDTPDLEALDYAAKRGVRKADATPWAE